MDTWGLHEAEYPSSLAFGELRKGYSPRLKSGENKTQTPPFERGLSESIRRLSPMHK